MSAVELAVAFVFFSNAVFLVAAGFVLFRMMRHTREAQAALGKAARNTEDVGRRVRELVHQAGPALAGAAAAPGAGGSGRGDEGLRADVERLHHQARDLVQRLAALLRDAAAAGTSAAEAVAPSPVPMTTDDTDLARDVGRLQADNQDLRERMKRLQAELGGVLGRQDEAADRDPGRDAGIEPPGEPRVVFEFGPDDGAGLDELRAKMGHVERENGQLRSDLDELKDQIARTLREKDFIERRFLLLDQALVAAGAPVAPADEEGAAAARMH